MKIITKRPNGTKRVATKNEQPSKTDQSYAKDVNVNSILEKYQKTGVWPKTNKIGTFADLSELPDLATALQTVATANESFASLPSNLRSRFGNDPTQLMAFLNDPNNRQEAISLGLLPTPSPIPEPISQTKKSKKAVSNDDELNDDDKSS